MAHFPLGYSLADTVKAQYFCGDIDDRGMGVAILSAGYCRSLAIMKYSVKYEEYFIMIVGDYMFPPRLLPSLLLASLVAACTPSEPVQIAFKPSEVAAHNQRGNASLNGSAFITLAGQPVTCAGDTVFLVAGTSYAAEIDRRVQTSSPQAAILALKPRYDDPSMANAYRRTVCDAHGNFAFDQIAPGRWYVLTRVPARPEDPGMPRGFTYLSQFVTVAPGENARPVLTYRDAAYRYGGN